MYSKVIVPLDGSDLAEAALPHLEEIARGCSIPEILLVSVTEEIHGNIRLSDTAEQTWGADDRSHVIHATDIHPGMVFTPEPSKSKKMTVTMGRMARTAQNYLEKIAGELGQKGLNASVKVLIGNPAEEIIRLAEEENADLIVLASRGKSGFSRWDMGNIAEKVVRASKVPVMLVKPGPDFKETKPKRKGVPG